MVHLMFLAGPKIEHPIALILAIVISGIALYLFIEAFKMSDHENMDLGFGCIGVVIIIAWAAGMYLIFDNVQA
jgi:hypothetical protein